MANHETSNLNDHNLELDNELDIKVSKPRSSRFFFLLGFFGIFIFAWAGCYNLYEHKFIKQDGKVEVNESSLYEPKYK
jgi:hypothetical protein